MRLPRFRLTVRQAMLIVLLVAALLGAFEAGRQWERGARRSEVPLDLPPDIELTRQAHKPHVLPELVHDPADAYSPPLDLSPPQPVRRPRHMRSPPCRSPVSASVRS